MQPQQPWPAYQDISIPFLLLFYIFPLILLNVTSAFFSPHASRLLFIVSAVATPIINIAFSALSLHVFSRAFKGEKNLRSAVIVALIANIPFMLILVISYHLANQFVWLGLIFSIYLAWFGLAYLLKIPADRRIPYLLISILTLGVFWIIIIFFIQIFTSYFL